ncbi:double-strand break repair helicase AddA [Parvularcula lutaonensis]|uniref:DNA 3'-5' helicase n=1 Tax=Parvularcula lutaonensis TaxID=491923 RepID=A0ABV7MDL9_9PROT|nr:double-strand break repair helicase AddA [Parvularcula lutaonensis]GGY37332.1 double-strand break repair helicase AddA [Parvularcula lutaonensis]
MSELKDFKERTDQIQSEVGNPANSAWVSANAGTGKTYILVRRVIRQLLAGAKPASIVCITFTKAAAAEMADRLLGMLSDWALMEDEELVRAIKEVTGGAPDKENLGEARQLFAEALESPGGLKIQTIHSFCSSILSRFPAEAGLPLGFRALEDDEANALLREATRMVAEVAADPRHDLHADLNAVTERFQGEQEERAGFEVTLEDALRTFARKTRGADALPEESGALPKILDDVLGPKQSEEDIVKACFDGLTGEHREFLAEIEANAARGKKRANQLAAAVRATLEAGPSLELLENPFALKNDGTPYAPGHFGKDFEASIPSFERRYMALCDHIRAHRERLFLARIRKENDHFIKLAWLCLKLYRGKKAAQQGLDYDDLIEKTLELLTEVENAWVQYKLDAGIEHVLLDEAQDTSRVQWELFKQLVAEIVQDDPDTAGVDRQRSLFVVGDPKQSIYAFNGAEAALFNEYLGHYTDRLGPRLASHRLFLSFRTSQPVLDIVDAVFDDEAFRTVSGDYERHHSAHPQRSGSVEFWPPFPDPGKKETDIWDTVDRPAKDSIDRQAAMAIAKDIQRRIKVGVKLACKGGRPLRAADVMVLFQRRGPRFRETLRALAEMGIPSAGTDRIEVAKDPAVRDMLSLLRFTANRDDGLSLAVLLKSPFFGWDEKQLYDLCHGRERQVLWSELQRRAQGTDSLSEAAATAVRELRRMADTGMRHGPYRLLASFLDGGEGPPGRARIERRLGTSYVDAVEALLDEALSFEDSEARSIHGFLHRVECLNYDIKREIAGEEITGVRVMTVHGAKGLEAPLVYVGDADYLKKPADAARREPFVMAEHPAVKGELPILVPIGSKNDPAPIAVLRADGEEKRLQEYQRLFYVAATRAEEHLVICGGKEAESKSWYGMTEAAFARLQMHAEQSEMEAPWGGMIRKIEQVGTDDAATNKPRSLPSFQVPQWLNAPAREEVANPVIYPSAIGSIEDERGEARPVAGPLGDPRRRGLLVHKLLEFLPRYPKGQRRAVALRLAETDRQALGEGSVAEAIDGVLGILDNPRYAELFGERSRAEVSIQGQVEGVTVSGQIDRLLLTEDAVVAVEFKSSRWVPESEAGIPVAHRRQVETYLKLLRAMDPAREARAVLLYTAGPVAFDIL